LLFDENRDEWFVDASKIAVFQRIIMVFMPSGLHNFQENQLDILFQGGPQAARMLHLLIQSQEIFY